MKIASPASVFVRSIAYISYFLVISSICQTVEADISSDLVFHADFETPNAVNDKSGSGNHGINHGATYKDESEDLGYQGTGCYRFDGINDYINFGTTALPTGASPRTISAWFKVIDYRASVNSYSMIFGYGAGASAPDITRFNISVSKQGNLIVNLSGQKLETPTSVIALNTWNHAAAVYDGSDVMVYLNGVEVMSEPKVLNTGNANCNIGKLYPTASNTYYYGYLDELRVYSRALTETEVSDLYNYNPSIEKKGTLVLIASMN